MISLWIYSLLPMLLLLFDIWLLPEEHEDVEVFITDAMLLTVTCSWFCTRLLEFSLMSLCKNSFPSSSNARLPSSILKENRRNIQKQPLGRCSVEKRSFVPRLHDVDIGWPVLHKKVALTGDCFSLYYFTRDKNGFVLQRISYSGAINKVKTGTLRRILNYSTPRTG